MLSYDRPPNGKTVSRMETESVDGYELLTRISHKLPAAAAHGSNITAPNGETPDCSKLIQLHRRLTVLHCTGTTLHDLATKFCEICGLSGFLFVNRSHQPNRSFRTIPGFRPKSSNCPSLLPQQYRPVSKPKGGDKANSAHD